MTQANTETGAKPAESNRAPLSPEAVSAASGEHRSQRGLREQFARLLFAAACVITLGGLDAYARASQLVGSPQVQTFAPDIEVASQNFCVAQDQAGIIYICNRDGVLEYDGERWRLTRLPNNQLARSISVADDGTLYVGGYDLVGSMRRDAEGRLQFTDLTPAFREALKGRELAEVWETLITPEGIYFRTLFDLLFWDPRQQKATQWHHPGRFGYVSLHRGKTIAQFRGEGFKERVGNDWKLLPETTSVLDLAAVRLPLADGGILLGIVDGRWLRWSEGRVTPAKVPANLPLASFFLRAALLNDNNFALCGSDGRLFILRNDLKSALAVRLSAGSIVNAAPASDGSVLAVSSSGLHRADVASPWRLLGREQNLQGSLERILELGEDAYVMTAQGVMRSQQSDVGVTFSRTPWTNNTANDMIAARNGMAYVAALHDILQVDPSASKPVKLIATGIYPRRFFRSRFAPDRIYVATERGLRVLHDAPSAPAVGSAMPTDLGVLITHVVETSATEVWSGSFRHGVWRFTVSAMGELTDARRFTEKDGLRLGKSNGASVSLAADGTVLASTNAGFFRWNGEKFSAVEIEHLSTLRIPDERLTLLRAADGSDWAYSTTRLFRRVENATPTKWEQLDIRSLRQGEVIGHSSLADGRLALVSSNAILLFQPTTRRSPDRLPQVQLRAVSQMGTDGNERFLAINEQGLRINESRDALRFDFSLPEYVRQGVKRYQSRLIGHQVEFSAWSQTSRVSYPALPSGTYTFEVAAMDGEGNTSRITPFSFEIIPPWYARWWAKLVWASILVCAFLILIVRLTRYRTRFLQAENLKLENKVVARTQELADANRRLDMMAHLDGLTGIANRRRLDEYLPLLWNNCAEHQRSLAILVIDVDHFKGYNDTHGHLAGDELLKRLAQVLLRGLRRTEDLLARYGGEEFLVALPSADIGVATALAESLRRDVEKTSLGATISIGVCARIPNAGVGGGVSAGTVEELIAAADAALYRAKHNGRNRVAVCEPSNSV